MKSYTSGATKPFAILTLISAAVFAMGIVFIALDTPNIGLQIGLTMLGGLMSILFLLVFWAEKGRYLTIDSERLDLPRGADRNGKISFKRTVVKINEIRSMDSKLYQGDGVVAKDTFFHTLTLNDGTTIQFALYAYGKNAEKEIVETIQKRIT